MGRHFEDAKPPLIDQTDVFFFVRIQIGSSFEREQIMVESMGVPSFIPFVKADGELPIRVSSDELRRSDYRRSLSIYRPIISVTQCVITVVRVYSKVELGEMRC